MAENKKDLEGEGFLSALHFVANYLTTSRYLNFSRRHTAITDRNISSFFSMRKTALSYVGDVVFLPFLYETRTILQLRCSAQIRPFSSHSRRREERTDESKPSEQPKQSNFLKAKAIASKASSKRSGKGGTTVTQGERRVFYDIFNQVAGKGPAKDASTTREKRDAFVDHEEILAIFSSAVSSHVAEQKALKEKDAAKAHASKDKLWALEDEEQVLRRYPKSLRKLARRTSAAVIGIEESGRLEDSRPRMVTEITGESEPVKKSSLKRSLKAEEEGILDGFASSVIADTARSSNVSEAALPAQLGQEDQAQPGVQHNHENNGQTHLDEEFDLPTSVGSATPRTAQIQGHRPSSFNADKNDQDIQPSMGPSFVRSGGDVGKRDGSNSLPVQPTSLKPFFLSREKGRSHLQLGLRPSFLATEWRAESVDKISDDNDVTRPSSIRRAEDVDVVQELLQHDPEAVFQTTADRFCREEMGELADSFQKAMEAGGDVGIWNACLATVFPMIKLLNVSLRHEKAQHKRLEAPTRGTPNQASKAGTAKASTELSPPEPTLADLPPSVPPLYVISRLYPAALLLAFRLLRTNFPTSPLSLAILPQIRSLGPTSYVLGASSEFYNALIELRWDVYSDLKGIDGLLTEMERSGVEFDVGTWNTLVKIGGERFNDLHDADGGVRGTEFWERSHNVKWYQKVAVEWKLVIAARLREHGLGSEISEREYGTNTLPKGGQASAEQGTVWL